ncbi:MAG: hypothetical protein K9N10_19145 [Deltaproteobacteria bacterium]|nr:hypothetical protein [Deltaproteobacteria bacterium]
MKARWICLMVWMSCFFPGLLMFGCSESEDASTPEPPPAAVLSSPSEKTPETHEAAKEKRKVDQELKERSQNRKDM